jgi:hypothetical protein
MGDLFPTAKDLREQADRFLMQEGRSVVAIKAGSGSRQKAYGCCGYAVDSSDPKKEVGCTWHVRAVKQAAGTWRISSIQPEHTNCAAVSRPGAAAIAGVVEAQIRANKSIKSTELQATLQAAGITAERRTVNNAKLQVKRDMALGAGESFGLLPPFLKAFEVCAV